VQVAPSNGNASSNGETSAKCHDIPVRVYLRTSWHMRAFHAGNDTTRPGDERPGMETGLRDRASRPGFETGLRDRASRPGIETGHRDLGIEIWAWRMLCTLAMPSPRPLF
jgi:hypothetical protein